MISSSGKRWKTNKFDIIFISQLVVKRIIKRAQRSLEEMDLHLNEDHDMSQDEREQFGSDFSEPIMAQVTLEAVEKQLMN